MDSNNWGFGNFILLILLGQSNNKEEKSQEIPSWSNFGSISQTNDKKDNDQDNGQENDQSKSFGGWGFPSDTKDNEKTDNAKGWWGGNGFGAPIQNSESENDTKTQDNKVDKPNITSKIELEEKEEKSDSDFDDFVEPQENDKCENEFVNKKIEGSNDEDKHESTCSIKEPPKINHENSTKSDKSESNNKNDSEDSFEDFKDPEESNATIKIDEETIEWEKGEIWNKNNIEVLNKSEEK